MMRSEAAWLGGLLAGVDAADLGAVLSIGSGTGDFRRRFQPWIDARVFDPLAARQVPVLHHEMHPAPGVDVAGDLTDPAVRDRLAQLEVRTVLCLNVLEHVEDRDPLVAALIASVPVGGRVVVTVPRRFPYHPDPIDTMYRPAPDELAAAFAGADIESSGTVVCESLALHWIAKPGKVAALRKAFRRPAKAPAGAPATQRQTSHGRPALAETARMAFVSTEVTYVVARRL